MHNPLTPFSACRSSFRSLWLASVFAWLLPSSILAAVTESFDSITDGSYATPDDYGAWFATNSMTATNNARGGSGKSLVFDDDAGAYLLYEGSDGNGKDGGLGTVSVWYRHWNGSGNVAFQAEYRQGAGSWVNLGGEVSVSSTTYAQFTADANVSGDNIQVRFRSTAYAERLCLDDVFLGDLSGPAEDPNLVAPSSLTFGTLAPGASATQLLALANTGASNTLNLTSLSPVSGDTSKFAPGALPASLAPGATAAVSIVYSPGPVTGAAHSAVFRLVSNDPSSPTQAITFSGQTIGAALTISNIQYNAGGTASPYSGSRVTVSGIATYSDPSGYAIADPAGGPWSGIYVSDLNHRPEHGDHVALEALVQETAAMTTLSAVSNYTTLATGLSVPPATIRANQLATEAYEGVYVRITNATVNNVNVNNQSNYWQATDGSSFLVNTRVPYRYIWTNNARLSAIQGIVHVNNSTLSLSPRNDWDFIGRPMFEYALRGLVITPEGPKTNWYVHVRDDLIVAVTNTAPVGVTALDTGGIIFPGLSTPTTTPHGTRSPLSCSTTSPSATAMNGPPPANTPPGNPSAPPSKTMPPSRIPPAKPSPNTPNASNSWPVVSPSRATMPTPNTPIPTSCCSTSNNSPPASGPKSFPGTPMPPIAPPSAPKSMAAPSMPPSSISAKASMNMPVPNSTSGAPGACSTKPPPSSMAPPSAPPSSPRWPPSTPSSSGPRCPT